MRFSKKQFKEIKEKAERQKMEHVEFRDKTYGIRLCAHCGGKPRIIKLVDAVKVAARVAKSPLIYSMVSPSLF